MPREVSLDGYALFCAYECIGKLTDHNSDKFDNEIFQAVQLTAYEVSNWEECAGKSQEEIWDATKAYFALGFCKGVYVGIYEIHEDTNLGNNAKILQKALTIYHRIRYASKPTQEWFDKKLQCFTGLELCVSRETLPKEI